MTLQAIRFNNIADIQNFALRMRSFPIDEIYKQLIVDTAGNTYYLEDIKELSAEDAKNSNLTFWRRDEEIQSLPRKISLSDLKSLLDDEALNTSEYFTFNRGIVDALTTYLKQIKQDGANTDAIIPTIDHVSNVLTANSVTVLPVITYNGMSYGKYSLLNSLSYDNIEPTTRLPLKADGVMDNILHQSLLKLGFNQTLQFNNNNPQEVKDEIESEQEYLKTVKDAANHIVNQNQPDLIKFNPKVNDETPKELIESLRTQDKVKTILATAAIVIGIIAVIAGLNFIGIAGLILTLAGLAVGGIGTLVLTTSSSNGEQIARLKLHQSAVDILQQTEKDEKFLYSLSLKSGLQQLSKSLEASYKQIFANFKKKSNPSAAKNDLDKSKDVDISSNEESNQNKFQK